MAVTNATATPAANCVVKADAAGHISISWIADNAVTLAKLATQANNTILGNITGAEAAPAALTATQVRTLLSLNNVENIALSSWAGTSNITTVGTIVTGTWHASQIAQSYIADGAISLAKMANLTANKIIGNNTNSSAIPIALTSTQVKTFLRLNRPFIIHQNHLTNASWLSSTSAADNDWRSVCWSPELGLFCAVANTGTGNRVMTSPDGVTWTIRTSAADNDWRSVCWSPELGLFCAVANTGTGNRVMTSPDGVTWTIRTSAADNNWVSVCWSPELGLFCAVAYSGTGNRVMTSISAWSLTYRAS